MTHHSARWGLLQICLAGVLWGTGGLALEVIREHTTMSVLTISAWRMGIAAAVLLIAVLVVRQGPDLIRLVRERPVNVLVVGAGTAAYQALYFASVTLVGVTVATVVSLGLAPLLLTLAESILARSRPSGRRLLTLGAALTGLVLVSATASHGTGGSNPTLGVLAALGSGAAYAFATLYAGTLARASSPLTMTTATTTVGAVLLLPFGLLSPGPLLSPDPVVLATLVYLGVMTMALAYLLMYAGLRTTPGSSAVIATLLEPVTAAVAAAVILDERVGPLGVLGTLMILGAVVGLGRVSAKAPVP